MVGGSIDVTGRVAAAPVALAGDVTTPSQNHRRGGGAEGDPHPGGRRPGVQVAQIAVGVVDVLQLGDRAVVDGKQPLCSRQGIEASGGLRNASDELGGGRWRDGEGVGWPKRSRKIPERIYQLIDALVVGDVVDGVLRVGSNVPLDFRGVAARGQPGQHQAVSDGFPFDIMAVGCAGIAVHPIRWIDRWIPYSTIPSLFECCCPECLGT